MITAKSSALPQVFALSEALPFQPNSSFLTALSVVGVYGDPRESGCDPKSCCRQRG